MKAPLPANEAIRLSVLRQYHLLDTPAEAEWDDLVRLAAHICETPVAAVVLVDEHRQWLKAKIGVDYTETDRDISFCAHAILEDDMVMVPDATLDRRFADNPQVLQENGLRFYCGVNLTTPDGYNLGTLCVADTVPRELTPLQQEALRSLRRQAIAQLDAHLNATVEKRALAESERRFRFLNDLGEATRTASSPREIMAIVARMLGQHLGASRCAYAEVQPDGERFTILDDYSPTLPSTVGSYNLSQFGSLACGELRDGRTLLLGDVDVEVSAEDGAAAFHSIGINAIICCPLIKGGVLRGMMAVHQSTPRYWTEGETALVEEVAERCWSIIERAQAEVELRESEEHLRFVIDASNDGIWEWDINTGHVYWSERIYSILGYSPETFTPGYEAQTALIHPDDVEIFATAIREHLESGVPYHLRVRYRRSDGKYLHILAQGRLQRDAAGRPLRMIGSFSDLTSLMEAEAAREAKSREIVSIWESMTDAFYTLDTEWRCTYVNPQAAELMFITPEQLLGKSIWDAFPAAVDTFFYREFHRAVAEGKMVDFEEYYPPFEKWFQVHAYPSSVGISVYFRDTTERKRSEFALLERARLAELSAEVGRALTRDAGLPDMLARCTDTISAHLQTALARIWTYNSEDEVLELQASAGLFGRTDETYGRVPIGKFKIGRIALERQALLTNDVPGDAGFNNLEWLREEGILAFAGFPMVVEERLVGVIALFSRKPLNEVTRQTLVAAADAVAVGIERKWGEDQRALLLEKERVARQEAEATSRVKDEFLATVSHELRTPLTAILGWSSMLRIGNLDDEDRAHALETIERNTHAQARLIDDLLDVSRIITGKLRLEVRPVDLTEVIEAAVQSVRPAMEAKSIRLLTMLDPCAGPVSGDPDRLQQVVWNLLTNALKFTPKGGQVHVRLEQVDSHVEITVADSGQGMDVEFLPHIFDRFRQADQTSTRAFGGLGLGLSIVHEIVQLHGGTVRAESEGAGKGATFLVQLPRLAALPALEMEERRHPRARDSASAVLPLDCPTELDGLRVLVVDDEPDTRDLLRAVLERCGSRVDTAGSAAEALQSFEANRPDVLLSDIGMPDEDGFALIRQIRAAEAQADTPKIPAIALTAYARMEDRVRALRSGFQVHVPKPIEPVELVAVVASLVCRHEA